MVDCPLCREDGGTLIVRNEHLRVVLIDDADYADYPGYCRVIWNAHVREMTDIAEADRARLIAAVFAVEAAQRAVLAPLKINVASLGNMVPHVHWHLIPRFADDPHFPNPIWGERQRDNDASHLATRQELVPTLIAAIQQHLD